MKLTAKEIEAARKVIYDELRYHGVDNSSTIDALELLDALCAAAREDSLVGKRVRCEQIEGPAVVVAEGMDCTGEMAYTLLPWNEESNDWKLFRDGFEVLEADDAE